MNYISSFTCGHTSKTIGLTRLWGWITTTLDQLVTLVTKCKMFTDEKTVALKRAVSCDIGSDEVTSRIPPSSEKLYDCLPWLNIMTDIAITAALAEIKVLILNFEKINFKNY